MQVALLSHGFDGQVFNIEFTPLHKSLRLGISRHPLLSWTDQVLLMYSGRRAKSLVLIKTLSSNRLGAYLSVTTQKPSGFSIEGTTFVCYADTKDEGYGRHLACEENDLECDRLKHFLFHR